MTMVGSTARPGVRRGDVSEEPRRWLLIAVLVAALVPTTWAGCTYSQSGPVCLVHGNSQVPSINTSSIYDTIQICGGELKFGGGSERLTIQTGAFKNIKANKIEVSYIGNITCQPQAFSGVEAELKELQFDQNGMLTILDDAFDGLNQLKYLELSETSLNTLTRAMFAPLSHLDTLILVDNQIEAITDDLFGDLSQLTYLYLTNTHLKRVSRLTFMNCSHLEKLHLGNMKIETIDDEAFDQLKQLDHLDLRNNRLKTVNHNMFKHLSRLETLCLRNNRLETIPCDTFDGLTRLWSLSLSNNRLKTVSYTMFSHLSRLEFLFLDDNTLETIPDDAFLGLGRLYYLGLNDNPLVCDCQLAWVQKYEEVEGTCANPPTASGQLVRSYDVSECNPDDTTTTGIFASFHKCYN